MLLENISLLNFKNYKTLDLGFSQHINCFVGHNGCGKTNLMDAIYFLSMAKSAFNTADYQNIKHQEDFFVVKGNFLCEGKKYSVQGSYKIAQKKIIKINNKAHQKISGHIGTFPVVLIAPYDTDIIRQGGEIRRKFFDRIICQIDEVYLQNLIRYNQILKQRNSLLRQFHQQNIVDISQLEPYNHHLFDVGGQIYTRRSHFVQAFYPLFIDYYKYLSESKEKVSISYTSDFENDNFKTLFSNNIKKDLALQRTGYGAHKDDFIFKINDYSLKKLGSQGQQKSFLMALKFAQFDIIEKHKNFKPILLLDDIFDKLDDKRITKLTEMIAGDRFKQLFVTDARPERTSRLLKKINMDICAFNIKSGVVSLLKNFMGA